MNIEQWKNLLFFKNTRSLWGLYTFLSTINYWTIIEFTRGCTSILMKTSRSSKCFGEETAPKKTTNSYFEWYFLKDIQKIEKRMELKDGYVEK